MYPTNRQLSGQIGQISPRMICMKTENKIFKIYAILGITWKGCRVQGGKVVSWADCFN